MSAPVGAATNAPGLAGVIAKGRKWPALPTYLVATAG
jgi:hypothetical protein